MRSILHLRGLPTSEKHSTTDGQSSQQGHVQYVRTSDDSFPDGHPSAYFYDVSDTENPSATKDDQGSPHAQWVPSQGSLGRMIGLNTGI